MLSEVFLPSGRNCNVLASNINYLLPIMLENLICLFHGANNLHMSDLKSCLHKAAMIFLQNKNT